MDKIKSINKFIKKTFLYPSGPLRNEIFCYNSIPKKTYERLRKFLIIISKKYENNFKNGVFIGKNGKLKSRHGFAERENELNNLQKTINNLLNITVKET